MGGNLTYPSDCCGETATVTELGIGTGHFELSGAGAEPCFAGMHTIYASDVKYNAVNMFQCIKDSTGACLRQVSLQEEVEPVFRVLEWGGNKGVDSGSDEGYLLESNGSKNKSTHRVRYNAVKRRILVDM
jgi:hypothetical protein